MLKYSIIIPTCNKALVKKCLHYISKLNSPKHEYEVLVVHNASKEDIESVVKDYKNLIPNLRYFFEQEDGLMSSRHRGAKEAKGEILCYLDDDSFVDKNYLIGIEETFKNSDVVLAGGNNLPLYETKPPKWLKYFWSDENSCKIMSELSLLELKVEKAKLPTWYVMGCNFIIKKDVLFKHDGFNPDGMPQEIIKYRGDGETAIACKLNQAGHVAYFNKKIKIHHYIPNSRMTLEYLKKRAFCQGITDSFSKIRAEQGFDYINFIPNENIDIVKRESFLKRKYNKVQRKLNNYLNNFNKDYKEYLTVKNEYEKSYKEGYDFHQNEVKNDSELLKWVLKETYL